MYKVPKHKNRKEIPEYHIWIGMRNRCSPTCSKHEGNYKKNNITVSREWDNFITFYEDLGPRPSSKHSIERIKNNLGYSKENCKWATQTEQCSNRGSFNQIYTYDGQTMVLKEWAKYFNINYSTLHKRISRGKTFEEAISLSKLIKFNNEEKSAKDWAKEFNLKPQIVYDRLSRGWSIERTLTQPVR